MTEDPTASAARRTGPRPTLQLARCSRALAMALLLIGCDQFKTNVPPPPTFAEREAMRQAKLASAGATIEENSTDAASPSDNSGDASEKSSSRSNANGRNASRTTTNERRITPHTDWTVDETAADALGRIGAASVPALVECLTDERPELRRRAAQILARIGPDAAIAVPALTQLLHDADPEVQREAARALGQIGPAASPAIPDLLQLFDEPPQGTTRRTTRGDS